MYDSQELSEAIVDQILVDVLNASTEFRQWFAERVGIKVDNSGFRGAYRSVWQGNGESDVVAEWDGPEGKAVVMVEDKLAVGFQQRQGQRYSIRANSLLESGEAAACVTVLMAPADYLAAANPEARYFDVLLPLDEIAEAAKLKGRLAGDQLSVLEAVLRRVNSGSALGAKGLHPDIYLAIAKECDRRGGELRITNNATDWIFFDHSSKVPGLEIRYRIGQRIAELAFTPAFRADVEALLAEVAAPFSTAVSGSYQFLRHPILPVGSRELFCDADAPVVVNAVQSLIDWWNERRLAI